MSESNTTDKPMNELNQDGNENWTITAVGEHIRLKQGTDEVYIRHQEVDIVAHFMREVRDDA